MNPEGIHKYAAMYLNETVRQEFLCQSRYTSPNQVRSCRSNQQDVVPLRFYRNYFGGIDKKRPTFHRNRDFRGIRYRIA